MKWTNVEDQLPHDGDMCLIFNGKSIWISEYDNGFEADKMNYLLNCIGMESEFNEDKKKITHWMLMPEKPVLEEK